MNDFFEELFKWLEEQENNDLDAANEYNCFEEIGKADALRWCAERSEEALKKVKELRKKYMLY